LTRAFGGTRLFVVVSWMAVLLGIAGVMGCSNDDCRVPVDQLGCKATFDQQVQWGLSISPSDCPLAGPCGAHLVWRTAPGLGSLTCVYDQSGQQLLSARNCTDVPLSCGDNSLCMTGGQSINVENDCDVSALPRTCASGDGGQVSD
jgi:hypothetical protein